jgi:hypothetical protein
MEKIMVKSRKGTLINIAKPGRLGTSVLSLVFRGTDMSSQIIYGWTEGVVQEISIVKCLGQTVAWLIIIT